MKNSDIFGKDQTYIAHTYNRFSAANLRAGKVAKKCVESGLLILTAKEKLRIMPPLNISKKEIDIGLNILRKCLSDRSM